jgi:hypothetical protein
VEIISRARWGARYDNGFRAAPLPARELWLHHSVTIAPDLVWVDTDRDGVEDDEERAMRTLDQIGEDRFGGGISYTFAVMPSGRIYEGHGVDRQGAHTGGRNDVARAIVLVGDYSNRGPTEAQKRAVAWLIVHGHRQGWWTVSGLNGGHRQAPNQIATACPGDAALREIPAMNQLAADYRAGRINLDQEADDDMWTDQEKQLLFAWLEDVLRRIQSIHIHGFRAFDPDQQTPPSWRAGGDLTFLDQKIGGGLAPLIAKVDAGFSALSDDEAKLLAAIRAQPTGAEVDVDALAEQLRAGLSAELAHDLGRRLISADQQ